ncbi:DUF4826 domain-containing protein [Pseudidiomarina sediminum]|uniref:DUF4826 domain-containing protein n=1 Tax=Pseudidiomarina sediminum TaxID=431675 RepID=A0A432Z7W0_9GAMM|nr:DUF4826 family protein [Pseudidiomarina sediminum]RUO73962.1 DUF4826 domain-containing protein [Pseudidiomarina sediminum]
MAEAQQPQMTQEEVSTWVRTQFQAANKYLAENGIISDQVLTKESRYLIPHVAIWKFSTRDKKQLWLVNGDVPTDVAGAQVAKDARGALRHFSLQWQLKAQAIINDPSTATDVEKQKYANYLVNRAENLYAVSDQENLWHSQPEEGNS